jgi:hypothetical protein
LKPLGSILSVVIEQILDCSESIFTVSPTIFYFAHRRGKSVSHLFGTINGTRNMGWAVVNISLVLFVPGFLRPFRKTLFSPEGRLFLSRA